MVCSAMQGGTSLLAPPYIFSFVCWKLSVEDAL